MEKACVLRWLDVCDTIFPTCVAAYVTVTAAGEPEHTENFLPSTHGQVVVGWKAAPDFYEYAIAFTWQMFKKGRQEQGIFFGKTFSRPSFSIEIYFKWKAFHTSLLLNVKASHIIL